MYRNHDSTGYNPLNNPSTLNTTSSSHQSSSSSYSTPLSLSTTSSSSSLTSSSLHFGSLTVTKKENVLEEKENSLKVLEPYISPIKNTSGLGSYGPNGRDRESGKVSERDRERERGKVAGFAPSKRESMDFDEVESIMWRKVLILSLSLSHDLCPFVTPSLFYSSLSVIYFSFSLSP